MALLDRVIFNPAAGGTGDFVVASAVSGYQTPGAANAVNGKTYSYAAELRDSTSGAIQAWEVGRGVWTAATSTLARTTVLFSSNGNAKVSFVSAPLVRISALAEDFGIGSDITGTSGSILFADSNGNMAQDNTNFTWDATNLAIKLYGEPFVFGNTTHVNAFFANAGNFTATGSANIGIGDSALKALTSGADNVAIGQAALNAVTTTNSNVAIGFHALTLCTDTGNFALGTNALSSLVTGHSNVGIGTNSLDSMNGGSNNIAIGINASLNWGSGSGNIAIGGFAGDLITSGNNNTLIGSWEGPSGALSNCIGFSDGAGNLRLDYNATNSATWTFDHAYMVTPTTVALLPAAGIAGRRHFVTDANATTFASIVAGSGTNKVPVYDDGTNWRIG